MRRDPVEPEPRLGAAPRARPRRRSRAGVDVIYQGVLADDGWRGVADFLDAAAGRLATRRSTPSSRATRSRRTSSSSASTPSSSRGSRGARRSRSTCCSATASGESFRPQEFAAYARRVRSRLEEFVADPPPTEPYPCDHCGICEFKPRLRRVVGRGRPPLAASPASGAARSSRLAAAGITTLAQPRRAPAEPPRRHQRRHVREASPAGRAPAPAPRDAASPSIELLEPQPESGLRAPARRRRRATSSSTSRATRSGTRRAASSTSGASLDTDGDFDAAVGGRPRRASGARSRRSSTSSTSGSPSDPDDARLPLRGLRDHGAAPPDGPLRHARGARSTICSAAASSSTCSRSSAAACAPRVPGYGLKEMEVFLASSAQAEIKDGGTSIVEYERYMQTRDRRSSTRSPPTTRRTASPRACCATGCSSGGRRRSRVRARSRRRSRRSRSRAAGARPSAQRCARRCSTAGEELAAAAARLPRPRAQAGLVGVLRPDRADAGASSSRTPTRSACSRLVGEPEQDKHSLVHAFTLPGAGAQARSATSRSTRKGADAGEIVELDREARRSP